MPHVLYLWGPSSSHLQDAEMRFGDTQRGIFLATPVQRPAVELFTATKTRQYSHHQSPSHQPVSSTSHFLVSGDHDIPPGRSDSSLVPYLARSSLEACTTNAFNLWEDRTINSGPQISRSLDPNGDCHAGFMFFLSELTSDLAEEHVQKGSIFSLVLLILLVEGTLDVTRTQIRPANGAKG